MNNKQLIRLMTFACIHYTVAVFTWLSLIYTGLTGMGDPMFLLAQTVGLAAGVWAAFVGWNKFSKWFPRLLVIDLGWCIILMPFLFYAGCMGYGLALAQQNITEPRMVSYISIAIGCLGILFVLQLAIIPWTLFTMWLMRIVDKKWLL